MVSRRGLIGLALPALLAGCGWDSLYAAHEAGPAAEDLRAIRVVPIAERIGQRLEIGLRNALNPSGIPTPQRYLLITTLQTTLGDLGIELQGLATRGKIDVAATYTLKSIESGKVLQKNTVHIDDSFDIAANGYANVVAQDDARARTIEEIQQEIVARLTMFMQRHRADPNATDL